MSLVNAISRLLFSPGKTDRERDRLESRIIDELRGLTVEAKELKDALERCQGCECYRFKLSPKNGNA